MTRLRGNSGIDMKRLLLLLLSLLLAFTACHKSEHTPFSQDDDGYGCTDTETGIHYTALPLAFEPAKVGAVRGVYTDKRADYTRTYYEIPSLDPALYLGDNERGVWCAAEKLPVPEELTPTALLVCEEEAISVEIYRFSAGKDDAVIAEILTLWFSADATEKPEGARTLTRRVKLQSEELPGIYYCFDYCVWGEDAYFCEIFSGRTVAVPPALAAHFVEK